MSVQDLIVEEELKSRVSCCRPEGALLVSYLLLLQYHVSTSPALEGLSAARDQ